MRVTLLLDPIQTAVFDELLARDSQKRSKTQYLRDLINDKAKKEIDKDTLQKIILDNYGK